MDGGDEGSQSEGYRVICPVPQQSEQENLICIGAVSHRVLQADRAEDVAAEIRKALKYLPAEKLIVSSDCGFRRQRCNREIAFYKASAIAQRCNIVRRELGLPSVTYQPQTRCCKSMWFPDERRRVLR